MKRLLLFAFLTLQFISSRAQIDTDKLAALQLVEQNREAAGLTGDQLNNLLVSSTYSIDGMTMVYLQQTYKNVPVFNRMKVLAYKDGKQISNAGELIAEMDKVTSGYSVIPGIPADQAVRLAFAEQKMTASTLAGRVSGNGRVINYGKPAGVTEEVTAELFWFPAERESQMKAQLGWQVQVAPAGTDDIWHIRIDALTGRLIEKVNIVIYEDFKFPREKADHKNTGSIMEKYMGISQGQYPAGSERTQQPALVGTVNYNVIPYPFESPNVSAAQVRTNPWTAAVGNASTLGWHSNGTTDFTISRGNNVFASEDTLGTNTNNGIPANSTTSPDPLNFVFTPNYNVEPSRNPTMQQFCITNLFYWNNILHDLTYIYGFDEVSGNFQENNQGRGGLGNDKVVALAQSGAAGHIGGNANFATGPDGGVGRMRMYLFNPISLVTLHVNTPESISGDYTSVESGFSINNKLANVGPVTGQVVYYNDDAPGNTHYACNAPINSVSGKIALIDRGFGGAVCTVTVPFVQKVKNAQTAGAIAVIMVNNVPGDPIIMGGDDNTITIPAVMISQTDGAIFAAQLGNNLNVTLSGIQTNVLDGDLDNGVICHEFGHGISNRLTGGPATASCLQNAEQGGEGWGDYLGLMLTTDWANTALTDGGLPRKIGAYLLGPAGFRLYPYTTNIAVNPLTYASMGVAPVGTEVHNIGEIWCMALWEMTWGLIQQENSINPSLYNFSLSSTGGNSIAFKLVTEGMRLQPCSPGFIDARNAILTADMNLYGGRHQCAIWTAFAKRGMGYSALQGSSFSATDQTAATNLPPAPTITSQPTDQTVNVGSNASFTVAATPPVNGAYILYRWQVSTDGGTTWNDIVPAVTTPTLSLTAVTAGMNGNKYRCILMQGCATTTSNIATLTVTSPSGFTFTSPPPTTASCPGPESMDVVLSTTATGGFSNPITLSSSTPPGTTTVSFIPGTVVSPGTSFTVRLNGTNTLSAGSYVLTITGTATGATTQTRNITFTINAGVGPVIGVQPANQTVCAGGTATFSVGAEGSYQWQVSTDGGITYNNVPVGSPYTGITTSTLTITPVTAAMNNYRYRCIVSTLCGSTTSNAGILTVNTAPAITAHPANASVCTGANNTFTVTATGTNLTYQWQLSTSGCAGPWNDIPAATTSSYTLTGITAGQNNTGYRVVVSGSCAPTATSNCALLTVVSSVTITSQPADQTICAGSNASFTVAASGSPTYQWQVSTDGGATYNNVPVGAPYGGINSATLTITAAPASLSGNRYRVVLTSSCGSPTSNSALLTVNSPAAITSQPTGLSQCTGTSATFCVTATGTNLTYQWEVSTAGCAGPWTSIPAATSNCYTIPSVTAAMNNTGYRCRVTAACGATITSDCALLTVATSVNITSNPSNQTICEGTNTSFTVAANGATSYQWQVSTDGGVTYNNVPATAPYSGGTTTTLTITNTPASFNNNRYRAVASNAGGCAPATSTAAILTVNSFPVITTQPQNLTICEGAGATFSVVATTAVGALSYQWQVSTDGGTTYSNISGATSSSFAQANVIGQNGYRFRVIVTAGCGSSTSTAAILTVNASPAVTFSPPATICVSDPALTLTASPTGGVFSGSGVSGSTFSPSVAGTGPKVVTYTVGNAGCQSTVARTILVNPCTERGKRLPEFQAVFIYPIPNFGDFSIRMNTNLYTKLNIKLYNDLGQLVLTQQVSGIGFGSVIPVHTFNLPNGIYQLFLTNDETGQVDRRAASIIIYKQ